MYKNKHLVVFDGIFRTPFCFLDEEPAWLKIFSNFHDIGLDYGYACICRKYQVGNQFRKTPKWFWVLEENDLKKSWKWRCKQSFASARTFRQSIVKSKILPIVFVEDIPVKALMPNLVQLYQKTLLPNVQEQTYEFMNRQLSRWIRLRLCSHLPEIPPWKSWNDVVVTSSASARTFRQPNQRFFQ